jgi:tetratricopeptide (TPR) repeat protein
LRGHLKAHKLQDTSGALKDYNRAIELDPKLAFAYYSRGLMQDRQLKDRQSALKDYNRAIELDPNYEMAYLRRAFIKFITKDFQGALADSNRTIQINPSNDDAYFMRGLLKYSRFKDIAGGIADMRQAAKLAQLQGNTELYESAIELLKKWQATSQSST